MGVPSANALIEHIRRLVDPLGDRDVTDGQLLDRFTRDRDEGAFAGLVRRHGAMVLGACRRVLGQEQDAEDAFQATFLVLARKAGSIRQQSVAGWLFTVARHLAARAKVQAERRRTRERELPVPVVCDAGTAAAGSEIRRILDEELHRLPDKYRDVVLLCCLENKTLAEAAGQLGWKPGAVKKRLECARRLLRGRLTRRGLTVSAALLAGLGADQAVGAAVPLTLAEGTARAAVVFAAGSAGAPAVSAGVLSLALGGLTTMAVTKFKLVATMVLACVLAGGGGAVLLRGADGPATDRPAAEEPKAVEPKAKRVLVQVEPTPEAPRTTYRVTAVKHGPGEVAAVSPDRKIVAMLQDGKIRLIHVGSGKVLMQLVEPKVRALAFSPDQKILAAAGGGKIRLVDAATGKIIREIAVPESGKIAFSPDGRTVTATITWDLQTGRQLGVVLKKPPTPNGSPAANAGRTAALKDLLKSNDPDVRRLAAELLDRLARAEAKEKAKQEAIYKGLIRRVPLNVKPAPRTADLEKRLDQLIAEIQELKKAIHGKKGTQVPTPREATP